MLEWLNIQKPELLLNCFKKSNWVGCESNNLKYGTSNNVFHLAASLGHLKVGKWLLEKLLDLINLKNEIGQTPCDIAKLNGKTDFMNWLISVGGTTKQ